MPNASIESHLDDITNAMRGLPSGIDRAQIIRDAAKRFSDRKNGQERAREDAIRAVLFVFGMAENNDVDVDALMVRAIREHKT
tara:strand:- start:1185 stop:1433 length:249 start_codon:yes stop_codon:yes gene_type:complete